MSLDGNKNFILNFAKRFFDNFFWGQHPEAALRYLPVVAAIKKARLTDSRILEVGSGSLGITPYLKKKIDGLDIGFTGPQTELVNKIKGHADNLPFWKNSYDVVISTDVLEHLAKERREKVIYEMLRVAKKLAVIVAPQGELSERQDKELDAHFQKVFGTRNQFLEEHVRNGLPRTAEILVALDKSLRKLAKKAKIGSFPVLNLAVRDILMKTWMSRNKFIYYLYLKGYLLFLPLLKLANFGNCYRRVFVIEFESSVKTPLEPSEFTLSKVEGNNSEKARGKSLRGTHENWY